jgi:uncharacterized protein YciI
VLYVIFGRDAPGSLEIRKRVRARHLDRVSQLVADGRIAIAGPCPIDDSAEPTPRGFSGSVIIAEFDSLDAAREWTAGDPYVTDGVFESWEVRPFIKVLP